MPTPRVLVVDDEHLIRWSLEQHLEKNGYEVITTGNGREAVQIVQDVLPEAVLLDIQMPGMDGIEVLRAIREIDPDVPVVMITAHGGVGSAVAAMKLGAYDYVEKPFDIERITVLLANALERRTLKGEVTRFRSEQGRRYGLERMVGESPAIRQVKETIEKIARSDAATVLLQGESGTGKDLAAKIVHYQSARGTSRSSRSTVRPCPRPWSRASCSATSAEPTPTRRQCGGGCSSWLTAGPSSWTRSATCRSVSSPSS